MHKHTLFISWTLILVCIAVLHMIALEFFLYWVYPWFDIMMHFLGGLFVGLSVLWFFFESGYVHLHKSIKNVLLTAGSSIVLVGIGWEVFEVLAGIPIEDNFALDTTIDLIMDVFGTLVAGIVFVRVYMTEYINKKQKD